MWRAMGGLFLVGVWIGAYGSSGVGAAEEVASGIPQNAEAAKHIFEIGEKDFLLDGKPLQIRCGEIHAARVPREYWRHRLQMAKAMGLNTVCAYLFWNLQEPTEGKFDWNGQADAAEFCRIAQQEGLWVILRPGPYSCAEWEMGGMPWWLLKNPRRENSLARSGFHRAGARVSEGSRAFTGAAASHAWWANFDGTSGERIWIIRQRRRLHGRYPADAARRRFRRAPVRVQPSRRFEKGVSLRFVRGGEFWRRPGRRVSALRQVQPKGPAMCGEFYPGWFDTWGVTHHMGNTGKYLTDLEYMLKAGASFSIYMAHGGTTFGLWSGADRPFKPDTSSYDYDAPISEAGWATPKFTATRELMNKYLASGETLPEPPAAPAVITFDPVTATAYAPIFENLPAAVHDDDPRPMEVYDQGHGCILYRTTLPAGPAGMLNASAIHDIAEVDLDGKRIGFMDRRKGDYSVALPCAREGSPIGNPSRGDGAGEFWARGQGLQGNRGKQRDRRKRAFCRGRRRASGAAFVGCVQFAVGCGDIGEFEI